ncbi:MAG: SDR family NAD(P)-dependent oxidoreductase [Candidatus Dormibacteria bacterium]
MPSTPPEVRPVAVVTGASSGIGAATARVLHDAGYDLVLGARRLDRLREVARPLNARAIPLDVTDQRSVDGFAAAVGEVSVLVNNAGAAHRLDPIGEANPEDWERMFQTNVMGVMRLIRALLPALEASGRGHVVNLGSTASFETYRGGAGYTGSKHWLRAISGTLRLELLGRPVRVTEIDPGMVETEFSLVRFEGDADRAAQVYRGVTALTADDVAACVAFAVTRPAHVNLDQVVLRPVQQATSSEVHRRDS